MYSDRELIDRETARFREREAREQDIIRREEAILKERVDREFAPIRREEERIRLMNEKLKADKAAFKAKYNVPHKNINEF